MAGSVEMPLSSVLGLDMTCGWGSGQQMEPGRYVHAYVHTYIHTYILTYLLT